jgi:methylisocitrate lyase
MTYLVAEGLSSMPAGHRLASLLAHPGILRMPGAHNGMAALQAKAAGFESVYLSGAAMTASMGLPDLGVLGLEDVCWFARQISRAAAVQIEDQILQKKCGHLNDKKLADPLHMAAKIAAARKARRHLMIVARTDAAAEEGMDGAVARAERYIEAGADIIFPEALINAEMFAEFAKRVKVPLLANMTEFGRSLSSPGQNSKAWVIAS